ncbi:hypothetical protein B0I37DRAFT_126169 [Chaetomium sp. MPI-CAGE-AT-0009]|nr:hypothetical protein B0I37DRAFT_126169 [Chaetomium sp. MPI-CAGE-AT-0009]
MQLPRSSVTLGLLDSAVDGNRLSSGRALGLFLGLFFGLLLGAVRGMGIGEIVCQKNMGGGVAFEMLLRSNYGVWGSALEVPRTDLDSARPLDKRRWAAADQLDPCFAVGVTGATDRQTILRNA